MILDKQFIIIIGSPRSGTSWLRAMIGAHPQVCTTVELTLYSRYTGPWIEAWQWEAANIEQGRWHQGLPFLWTQDEFYDFLREFLAKAYEKVVAINPRATHILDKHPGYSMYVEDINWLLPNVRFIHIIRDGRDVAGSMVAARRSIGFGTATTPESAAEWKRCVLEARKARQYQGRYLEVRYEELLTAGVHTLKTVFDFCGLPASVEDVAAIVDAHQFERVKARRQAQDKRIKVNPAHYRKGQAGSWREDLDLIQRYLFDEIAGDLLHKLGYANDGWWAKSRIQRYTLPLLAGISTRQRRRETVARAAKALLGPTLTGYVRATRAKMREMNPWTSSGNAL